MEHTSKADLISPWPPRIIPLVRPRNEHGSTILSRRPRRGDQARELAGLAQVKCVRASMPNAVHVIVAMQRLAGRAGSNMEGQADAQQRVDRVLLDHLLADHAVPVLQDVRAQVLEDGRRLADVRECR